MSAKCHKRTSAAEPAGQKVCSLKFLVAASDIELAPAVCEELSVFRALIFQSVAAVEVVIQAASHHSEFFLLLQHESSSPATRCLSSEPKS